MPGVEKWRCGSLRGEAPGELTLWRFFRDAACEAEASAGEFLDDAERQRAALFVFEADRQRWVWWRSRLRLVLAELAGAKPAELRFAIGDHGKPTLEGNPALHFNLSHSGETAILGTSRTGEIGVDVEVPDPAFPALEIAREYFRPAEVAAVEAAPDEEQRRARFFRLWTAKEALMKATGLGMALEPHQIEVLLTGDGWPKSYGWIDGFRPTDWQLACLEGNGCVVSVARRCQGAVL